MSLYDSSQPPPDPYSEAYAVQPNDTEANGGSGAAPADGARRDRSRSRSPRRERSGSQTRERRRHSPPGRPKHAPTNVNPTSVLGVFGLSIRTQERDLEDEFSRYGKVEKVTIVYDQRSDRSRGFGFIRMATTEDATRCIERLNGVDLNGRRIRVDFSVTDRAHAPTPGQYMGHIRRDEDRYRGRGGDYRSSRDYDRRERRDDHGRDRDRGDRDSWRDDFGRDSDRRDSWRDRDRERDRDRRSPRRHSRSPPPRRRYSTSRSPDRRDRERERDRSDARY